MAESINTDAFLHRFTLKPYSEGKLSGFHFAVKDVIDIASFKTGLGNPDWEKRHPPAKAHAICVEQLLSEGAICLGKTVTDEFAFSLYGVNEFYGIPLNPNAPERIPGGSSSGSASLVASGIVDFALGTDTGGSIRIPAHNCGIFGFRPTIGRISLAGVEHLSPSFDTVGVLAKDVRSLEMATEVLLGSQRWEGEENFEIAFLEEAFNLCEEEIKEGLKEALAILKSKFSCKWINLEEIFREPVSLDLFFETFKSIQLAEIWTHFGSWIENERPHLGERTRINFENAKAASRRDLAKAFYLRNKIKKSLNAFLQAKTILCLPTSPCLAPKKGSLSLDRFKDSYYSKMARMLSIAGLGSLPQVSLPVVKNPVPMGISFLAKEGNDERLLWSSCQLADLLIKSPL